MDKLTGKYFVPPIDYIMQSGIMGTIERQQQPRRSVMQNTYYYIGTKQDSDVIVSSISEFKFPVYKAREEAEANLERVGALLVEENKMEAQAAGEEYDPQDPDQWQPEDLRVFRIIVDGGDQSQ